MVEYEWQVLFVIGGVNVSYTLTTDVNDRDVAIAHALADIRFMAGLDVSKCDEVIASMTATIGYPVTGNIKDGGVKV